MKIMFVIPYFGFSGVISDTLAGHLSKRGNDVVVVGFSRKALGSWFSEEARCLEEKNIHCYSAPGFSISIPHFVTEFPLLLSFGQLTKEIDPDIIHINCLPFLTSFQAAKIASKTHRKGILQVHGVIGERGFFFNMLQEVYNSVLGQSAFHSANKVVCLTVGDAQKVLRYGCPPQKIRIIPNGVNVNEFRPSGVEEAGTLLWCGRFVQQKGLEYLIEAMKLIKKEGGPPVKLTMTGEGPLISKISKLIMENDLRRNVHFLGRVARSEIPKLMNKSSIYVLPSLNEGMPYTLLEAMASGKPVIGSDISGIKDVVTHGKNGLLVPPRNARALADAIMTLLKDDNLRKIMGQKARELMVKKYSWDEIATRMERLYREQ
jgi:glycosyltransferase involved in cell wall biosynthesis